MTDKERGIKDLENWISITEKDQAIELLEKFIRITESVDDGWVHVKWSDGRWMHVTIEDAKKALELLKGEKDAGQGKSDQRA